MFRWWLEKIKKRCRDIDLVEICGIVEKNKREVGEKRYGAQKVSGLDQGCELPDG